MAVGTEGTTTTVAPARKGAGTRSLDGMVALVSGGGRGLGRLLSARLADAGAAVGLIARSCTRFGCESPAARALAPSTLFAG
jgi:NAD(P)-dependent dehydrogenase (short-subunit alcohol dehydrogenase family)